MRDRCCASSRKACHCQGFRASLTFESPVPCIQASRDDSWGAPVRARMYWIERSLISALVCLSPCSSRKRGDASPRCWSSEPLPFFQSWRFSAKKSSVAVERSFECRHVVERLVERLTRVHIARLSSRERWRNPRISDGGLSQTYRRVQPAIR